MKFKTQDKIFPPQYILGEKNILVEVIILVFGPRGCWYENSYWIDFILICAPRLGKVSTGIVNSISVEDVGSKNIKELLMKDTKDTKNYSYDAEFLVELNALPYRLTNFDE
ncbi:uncharacterized protein G2W53_014134 [Senna tora]|uniref:Uncharacterized protein n=1 Tax=Senna tora TaxID=362788 RepID=A0A834WSX6_9FABA|nr:uncharacterized protein G2W53_014134 [Senna tora]